MESNTTPAVETTAETTAETETTIVNFCTLRGYRTTVHGTRSDTLRTLLESAEIQMNLGKCRAFLNGIEATKTTLDKTAEELKLEQYNCIMIVYK